MAPTYFLAAVTWLTLITLVGIEAHQTFELKTRSSDGAALCAMDPPTVSFRMSDKLPDSPEAVRCGMMCTGDDGCKHFNYKSTESNPCQLYHYTPNDFSVLPNCQHYFEPGKKIQLFIYLLTYLSLIF